MRIRAIDWLRGLVILLMTVDHAGGIFDAAHLHGDNGARWIPGSPLPAGEFLTRWVTHLCAPTFVLLAGASLALSSARRKDRPGQTRFLVTSGLFIAALDPLWMSLGFAHYDRFVLQVLYAIGLSMALMAFLSKLSPRTLLGAAMVIQLGGELSDRVHPEGPIGHALWALLFAGGPVYGLFVCAYPLVPWLSFMMLGTVLGRFLLEPRTNAERASSLAKVGLGSLALFAVVRGVDGYGNWNLHRDSLDPLQWAHVAKYPPSLAYSALELGLALLLLSGLLALDRPARPRWTLQPLALFGATAFFFYLLHVHLMAGAEAWLALDVHRAGLAKTWLGAAITVAILAAPCWLYRRYKTAHPDGLARYV